MENTEKNTAVQPEAKKVAPNAPETAAAPKAVKPAVAKPAPAAPVAPAEMLWIS